MRLDIEDKNYISELIDRKFDEKFDEKFDRKFEMMLRASDERFAHHFGIIREDFNHKLAILIEIARGKPDRGEVREMIRKESRFASAY